MKANTKQQTVESKNIFLVAKAEVAVLFDMPEIAAAPLTEPAGGGFKVEVDIRPTGQMRALVKSLSARVEMNDAPDETGNYYIRASLSYSHHDGGSNGKDANFVVMVEDMFGAKVLRHIVPAHVYMHVQHQVLAEARKYAAAAAK